MDAEPSTTAHPEAPLELDIPTGDHPLEVAARRGIGPLSPRGHTVWHGESTPCVSCGQLVRRGAVECEDCGQDLSEEMIEKMRAHAGPWYVLEHLRPFPGVSLERIIKQIRRGLITEVSIVRGPTTDYQWRFAVETPGLCRHFGKCWHCHHSVSPSDTYCPACLSYLAMERPPDARTPLPAVQPEPAKSAGGGDAGSLARAEALLAELRASAVAPPPATAARAVPIAPAEPAGAAAAPGPAAPPRHLPAGPGSGRAPLPSGATTPELEQLAAAVQTMDKSPRIPEPDNRIGPVRATWIAACLLMIAVLLLLWVTNLRSKSLPNTGQTTVRSLE